MVAAAVEVAVGGATLERRPHMNFGLFSIVEVFFSKLLQFFVFCMIDNKSANVYALNSLVVFF